MTDGVHISIYLDNRRAKKDGTFPVKLRVFIPFPREQKLYKIPFGYTQDEFDNIWETKKPKKDYKEENIKLNAILSKANMVASSINPFNLKEFEALFFSDKNVNKNDIEYYYNKHIDALKKNKQIGTASNYELSLKSLLKFYGKKGLQFQTITPQWLERYENDMIDEKKLSQTTVGIYLRPLRAIFNLAIAEKAIKQEIYPFGKRKYTIPAPKSVKKALDHTKLSTLFRSVPTVEEQEMARDFWFFSYSCNGMNFKDIAHLKIRDIKEGQLTFKRAKTAKTNKKHMPVNIPLHNHCQNVINKYGKVSDDQDDFLFKIIDKGQSPEEQHKKVMNFIRFVNQHMLNFAKACGIEDKISTYWARHSFATNAIRQGASMEFVSDALQHSSLTTTKGYFAGFEDDKKIEMSNKLMDF